MKNESILFIYLLLICHMLALKLYFLCKIFCKIIDT